MLRALIAIFKLKKLFSRVLKNADFEKKTPRDKKASRSSFTSQSEAHLRGCVCLYVVSRPSIDLTSESIRSLPNSHRTPAECRKTSWSLRQWRQWRHASPFRQVDFLGCFVSCFRILTFSRLTQMTTVNPQNQRSRISRVTIVWLIRWRFSEVRTFSFSDF